MKVKEVLPLIDSGTQWQLVGGHSGKKLADNHNKTEMVKRYFECECTDSPVFISYRAQKYRFCTGYERVEPVISIWVNGE